MRSLPDFAKNGADPAGGMIGNISIQDVATEGATYSAVGTFAAAKTSSTP